MFALAVTAPFSSLARPTSSPCAASRRATARGPRGPIDLVLNDVVGDQAPAAVSTPDRAAWRLKAPSGAIEHRLALGLVLGSEQSGPARLGCAVIRGISLPRRGASVPRRADGHSACCALSRGATVSIRQG